MKAKLPIKTDWVIVQAGVNILKKIDVENRNGANRLK